MICKKCSIDKEEEYFRVANGYRKKVCKQCEADYQREYLKNPEVRKRNIENKRRYRQEHKEELRRKNHEYNMAHREERARKQREYYRLNKDIIIEKNKLRYQENKDMINRMRRQKRLEQSLNRDQKQKRRKVQKEVIDRVTEMVEEERQAVTVDYLKNFFMKKEMK